MTLALSHVYAHRNEDKVMFSMLISTVITESIQAKIL